MTDNTLTGVANAIIRTINRVFGSGTAATQVIALDQGGEAGPESLVTSSNPLAVADAAAATGLAAVVAAIEANGGGGGGSGGAVTQSGTWTVGLSGTLPAFGSTPTFNLGTLNGAALDSSVQQVKTALGTPFQAGGSIGNTTFGATQSGAWTTGRTWSLASGSDSVTATISGTPTVTVGNASLAVTGAFYQATQPVSIASLPLPSDAAQETGGNLASIAANTANTAPGVSDTSALAVQGVTGGVPMPVSAAITNWPTTSGSVSISDGSGPIAQIDASGNLYVNDTTIAQAQSSDAPIFAAITGDPNGDFAGVNLLEQAMTDGSGLGLNVKVLNFPKFDALGAQIMSDAPAPIPFQIAAANGYVTIDTTGYQSLNVTTQTFAGTVTTSNDGLTWSALTGAPLVLGAYVTAVAASTGYSFPVLARYIRFTATTAGTATVYLRAAPWNPNYTTSVPTSTASNNVAQFGGTNVVSAGVAGIPSVGGNIAPGTARTANPIPVGGVDSANLTRTVLTDVSGRPQIVLNGVDNEANAHPVLTDIGGYLAVSLAPTTTALINLSELLSQILAVGRVQAFQLAQIIQQLNPSIMPDDPEMLISDFLNPATDSAQTNLKN